MPQLIKERWAPRFESGVARRSQRGCDYEAYVPDRLTDRRWRFDGDTVADISDADRALAALQTRTSALATSEALARLLLRSESVASSRLEGLQVGGRRLLKAQVAAGMGESPRDVTAEEVLANIDAMEAAVERAQPGWELTVEELTAIHRRLLEGTRLDEIAGRIRTEQNWIGGSSFNPCSAAFVPPPPEHVGDLLVDLCAFVNSDALPPVAQAAIAHAQFETIHPFGDGNGRVGRALIHMVLRRRGATARVLVPVSLVLATRATDYIDGLTSTRCAPTASDTEQDDGWNLWIGAFAAAVRRAVDDAGLYQARVDEIRAGWLERLPRLRTDAAALRIIDALPGAPIVTVQSAAALIDRSEQATNEAFKVLIAAGVLKQTTAGGRNRVFEAKALIDAFTALERQLASPGADTRRSPPARAVPARPERR